MTDPSAVSDSVKGCTLCGEPILVGTGAGYDSFWLCTTEPHRVVCEEHIKFSEET